MPTRANTICPRCLTPRMAGTRCPTCSQRRGTTTQRGYDQAHKDLRTWYQAQMDDGTVYTCRRCTKIITAEQPWDLGHDAQRNHSGPEHADCNRGEPNTHRQG